MASLVFELLVLTSVTSFHPVDVNVVSYLRRLLLGARDPSIFLPRFSLELPKCEGAERTLMSPRGGVNRRDDQIKPFSPQTLELTVLHRSDRWW
jgi:hypothetical protein